MWVWAIFGTIAVVAAMFAAAPLFRAHKLFAALVAIAVAGAGLGLYAMLGRPDLAVRTFEFPEEQQLEAVVAQLAVRMREHPDDLQGWLLLGRGYFGLGAKVESAKALAEAVRLARAKNVPRAEFATILSDYAIALSQAQGMITPAAEAALQESLAADPAGSSTRFYLGLAAAQKGDLASAEQQWQALLADTPEDAPYRAEIVDRLAALKAQRGDTPDVRAMVEGLAARLAANPNDLEGWRRLVRSYAVLGEPEKARAALTGARTQFAADAAAMEAIVQTARENNLE